MAGFRHSEFPAKPEDEHHALADARWNRGLHVAMVAKAYAKIQRD